MIQPSKELMQRIIDLARAKYQEGGHAVAALIVKDGEVIAEAFTSVRRDLDPTAHAEINVIRLAAQKLQSTKLKGCYLYTTYEPCPMCASSCIWARLEGIVYGASREDRTDESKWRVMIPAANVIAAGDPKLELYPEFMREECKPLLSLSAKIF
ncbi:nucleoside deaminase [Candidatus Uhrbacteria bacterium]|nr:nucleoside deaminase [Candidatus Uhrbacteria bacterium]